MMIPHWIVLLIGCLTVHVDGCTLPTALTGAWWRPSDTSSITFTSTSVSGLGITYRGVDLGTFDCHSNSGDEYVLKSQEYDGVGSFKYEFYFCWKLVQVTTEAYMIYELSDQLGGEYLNARGFSEISGNSVATSSVCTRDSNTIFWTTLVKDGSTASTVKATCPSPLLKTFTYDRCSGTAEMEYCSTDGAGTMNYNLCSDVIYNSATGTVYCMGYVVRSPYYYLNLYNSDKGKLTTCLKFYTDAGSGNLVTSFYTGDCTTGESGTVTLASPAACPSTSTTESSTSSNGGGGTSENSGSASTSTSASGSGGGGTSGNSSSASNSKSVDVVAAAVGATVGVIALIVAGGLVYYFLIKGKHIGKSRKVFAAETATDIANKPEEEEEDGKSSPDSGIENGPETNPNDVDVAT